MEYLNCLSTAEFSAFLVLVLEVAEILGDYVVLHTTGAGEIIWTYIGRDTWCILEAKGA